MASSTTLKPVWNDRNVSLSSKIRRMSFLVISIFLYACESWTLTADLQRRTQAMERRCYRKVLHISYKDRVTNEEVRAGNWTIRRSVDHCKETQTEVVLSCFPFIRSGQNHTARHSERGKQDKADRGRGGKTTLGNGRVVEFAKSQRAVENRENGRE